ncbi:MAG: exodeoxyribonuclease VII small subunit [Cyclobacteriaceae bacterium]
MAKQNTKTFQEAFDSLRKLVDEIEQDQISLDQLTEKVEQAKMLSDFCSKKLRGIEDEVRKKSGDDWPEV